MTMDPEEALDRIAFPPERSLAPGQPDRQRLGCARAEECGVPDERVVTTWPAAELPEWAGTRTVPDRAARRTAP
jgi:hypothetical protein